MGQIEPINKTFRATIKNRNGWAGVVWPDRQAQPGDVIEVSLEERL